MSYPVPPNDKDRLKTLQRYKILDTKPEEQFDCLTKLAALICDAPISLMTLVDEHRQWFKATHGLDLQETPRTMAFCTHAIMQRDVFTVTDASLDSAFSKNPLVTGNPNIRFYAGAPLAAPDGHMLGSICVIDRKPRQLNSMQQEALRLISQQAVAQMELRKNLIELKTGLAASDAVGSLNEEAARSLHAVATQLEEAAATIRQLHAKF